MHLDKEMLKAYRTFESLEKNLTQEDIWEGRARWDIWNSKKGMPKAEARETFLSNVQSIEAKYGESV
ncbi:uncharacterized protein N7511_004505 [Penicillium nucicola]|uniref:uncharacterized protein n=1 Tax=Penicillium nucicola TaxID=1850975 RepID=UPI0025455582|nr:uncharacterized protein N7511_004505 [Penicillium nucicola]KAJ5766889.1 hypothetical protein N7511_004505 [Penicillium nucicola]